MDAVLGDLTIAQCKLVSESCTCRMGMWGWDTGWGLGTPALSRYLDANAVTTDLQAGKQDNSHPGWFFSQVILSQCGHSNINTLSKVPALLPCGGGVLG